MSKDKYVLITLGASKGGFEWTISARDSYGRSRKLKGSEEFAYLTGLIDLLNFLHGKDFLGRAIRHSYSSLPSLAFCRIKRRDPEIFSLQQQACELMHDMRMYLISIPEEKNSHIRPSYEDKDFRYEFSLAVDSDSD